MRMLPLSSNSQNLHFDISFVTDRTKAVDSYFLVRLDEAFPSVTSSTLINDGSEERANAFSGSGFERRADAVYLKIDTVASPAAQADVIGLEGYAAAGFVDGTYQIILAGDVDKIVAESDGTDTTLYKNEKGVNNVLAIMYQFAATTDNFTLDDFLVQNNPDFTLEVLPQAVTDGSVAGVKDLRGDAKANAFIIDTTPNAKGNADTITDFDLREDSITFKAEGGGAPANTFRNIWFKKDGDDPLITNSNLANSSNVLAVIKDVAFDLNSIPDLDVGFLTARATFNRAFVVGLDEAFDDVATPSTQIKDGSAEGKDALTGSFRLDSGIVVYTRIDAGASAADEADVIGTALLNYAAFEDGSDKIILAGEVDKIVAKSAGAHTTLYKDEQGDNNVLAIMYHFVATDDNFTLDDFLVQDGQTFTVEVL